MRFGKLRWRIERDYQELKGELGLDHFEGRTWNGFHHHVALCAAAQAFLALRGRFPPDAQHPGPFAAVRRPAKPVAATGATMSAVSSMTTARIGPAALRECDRVVLAPTPNPLPFLPRPHYPLMTGTRRPAAGAAQPRQRPDPPAEDPQHVAFHRGHREAVAVDQAIGRGERIRSSPLIMPDKLSGSAAPIVTEAMSCADRRTSRTARWPGQRELLADMPVTNGRRGSRRALRADGRRPRARARER